MARYLRSHYECIGIVARLRKMQRRECAVEADLGSKRGLYVEQENVT